LQVERILRRQEDRERKRAQRRRACDLGHRPLAGMADVGIDIGLPDIAGEQVSRADALTAAGTSAPIAIAESAKPANQDGNRTLNSIGTTSLLDVTLMLAA
jgi:hypothetical protein